MFENYNPVLLIVIGLTLLVVIVYILFDLRHKARTRPYFIKGPKDATVLAMIPRNDILDPTIGQEFSYSFWVNVEDWGYKYNKPKHIFHVGDKDATNVCPGVWLYPRNNNLMIRVDTHDREDPKSMNPTINTQILNKDSPCDLENIPVQRWCHVVIVLLNRTIDVYLNGKLARSCTLEKIPKLNQGNLYINQDGGYQGLLSDFMYSNEAISPSDIYSLYLSGYDAYIIYNYFNFVVPKLKVESNICKDSNAEVEEDYKMRMYKLNQQIKQLKNK
jgi:hypothetical protein